MQIIPQDFVMVAGNAVVTDTRKIAAAFNRRHDNVVAALRKMMRELDEPDRLLNFKECFDINGLANCKPERFWQMTKNGFLWLVMGFTGGRAMQIKVAYTKAFDRMADFIRSQYEGSMARFNEAMQQHLSDKRHVSHCARDMRRWQNVKPQQLEYLERLHPQTTLALA